jgi:hypothetical protein
MVNQLINGVQMVTEPSVPDPNEGKLPTFGYHADGRSQVFHLAPGETLPKGWADAPQSKKVKKVSNGNGP